MFLYTPFYALGWGTLSYPYLSELFPYYQRSQGIAVEHLTNRIALFSNNYVNPIALDKIGWRYYIVYCVWIAVEVLIVYFLFLETRNRTLEELAFLWEGDGVWNRVRERMDTVMAIQLHELGSSIREEEVEEPRGTERDDDDASH